MRVLLISHTCQSAAEGQPKAHCLARIPGLHLRVLVPDRWKHYGKWRRADVPAAPGFTLDVAPVRWPWVGPAQSYLHWYPSLRQTLEDFRPDVIDLWEEPWSAVSAHACWLRDRVLPSAKIVSETEQNIDKVLPFPFEAFRTHSLRQADYVVARNTEALQVLRNKGYTGPGEVVPNAVDAELFHPMDREACRRELGLTGFVAGYVGRLVEEKGLADLVDALAFCPDDVSLLFAGSGPFQAEIERRARILGRSNRLRFLGPRPLTELPRVMNAIDVLTLPSRTTARWKEQFGRVLIEANACGTPVIGSDSGAIPDVIGPAGLVFPEGNPKALAAAIYRLRDDAHLRAEMGAAGRAQVDTHYTWRRVAERMFAIYQKVVDLPAGPVTSVRTPAHETAQPSLHSSSVESASH